MSDARYDIALEAVAKTLDEQGWSSSAQIVREAANEIEQWQQAAVDWKALFDNVLPRPVLITRNEREYERLRRMFLPTKDSSDA